MDKQELELEKIKVLCAADLHASDKLTWLCFSIYLLFVAAIIKSVFDETATLAVGSIAITIIFIIGSIILHFGAISDREMINKRFNKLK